MRALLVGVLVFAMWVVAGCATAPDVPARPYSEGGAGSTVTVSGAGGSGASFSFASSGGGPCANDCNAPPSGWSGFSLFAMGEDAHLATCPYFAPVPGFEAHAGPKPSSHTCAACTCGLSETACFVPTEWHASAGQCPGDGAVQSSFDASPDWTGACNTENPVPGGALCNGAFCVQSVTVKAPEIAPAPCVPSTAGDGFKPDPQWESYARQCLTEDPGACPEEPGTCRLPAGFSLCIYRDGDVACPGPGSGADFDRHVYYRDFDDLRTCAPCECGAPDGGACTVLAKAFGDAACSALVGATTIDSADGSLCIDITPGIALRSKAVDVALTAPGTCAPGGGEAMGHVVPVGPVTLCCKQEQKLPG
jgi:hypothetical protein